MRTEIIVKGIVQGVGFRPFIYRIATENKLVGYVRNRGDAGVEIIVEGREDNVKEFVADLKEKKPPLSQIYDVSIRYLEDRGEFKAFTIAKSLEGGNLSGSIIPYDTSICDECLEELRNPKNRRYNYFFTTCTDCGPRYTMIKSLPYDRPNTTMLDFPMCEECRKEYANSSDRRFHAQTIACPKCGPTVFLTTNEGKILDNEDPIRAAGKLIGEGYIAAIKGNGGFHIAASTTRAEPIMRLREVKHRSQKPFAMMARDLQTVKSFAQVNEEEEKLLTSSIRPIILLRKRSDYHLNEQISPGLHNVGVMLPYTGLHFMLFDETEEPAFIMTSANPPSEPIVVDNKEAVRKLGQEVDFFLFHNRDIAQRCDDSVIRVHDRNKSIIRRSRGYAPSPVFLVSQESHCTLGVGAEENVNSTIVYSDKAFVSQYIGDVEKVETFQFLKEAIGHLMRLTNSRIEGVACDLHPQFITTKLAKELGEKLNCPVFRVQHHYAHILSLMGEKGLDQAIGIVCDGVGYGDDGRSWGGEVLHCTSKGFYRLGHLEEQPMVGGDLAARYPLRMAAGILRNEVDLHEWLASRVEHFPYREKEVDVIMKQLQNSRLPLTTSCGRILDAASALLGICCERTYDGEPAMKLESMASGGEDVLRLKPIINGGIVDTTSIILEIFNNIEKHSISDIAFSVESYLARSLALVAVEEAKRVGLDLVGFSGGVAYNEHMTRTMREMVEESGLKFIVHDQVPPGDGGISLGQALAANYLLDQ